MDGNFSLCTHCEGRHEFYDCPEVAKGLKALKALEDIKRILQKPAANQRFMQIAQPARQCLNIIKTIL